jgi:hypothetical protein
VNEERMKVRDECDTTGSPEKLTGNCSRRAGLKKGADVAVEERKHHAKKKKTLQA